MVFDINLDGSVKNKTLFLAFDDHSLEGMRCDESRAVALKSPSIILLKKYS